MNRLSPGQVQIHEGDMSWNPAHQSFRSRHLLQSPAHSSPIEHSGCADLFKLEREMGLNHNIALPAFTVRLYEIYCTRNDCDSCVLSEVLVEKVCLRLNADHMSSSMKKIEEGCFTITCPYF